MKKIPILVLAFVFFVSCNKDKFNTKPKLEFKSINTNVLQKNAFVEMNLLAYDAEGDLTDTLFVMKRTKNCALSFTNEKYKMPTFPLEKDLKAPIRVGYTNGIGNNYPPIQAPQCNKNDSCIYRFVIKDKAGNVSDTVDSPEFVIIK
jgi:hypothetical protein